MKQCHKTDRRVRPLCCPLRLSNLTRKYLHLPFQHPLDNGDLGNGGGCIITIHTVLSTACFEFWYFNLGKKQMNASSSYTRQVDVKNTHTHTYLLGHHDYHGWRTLEWPHSSLDQGSWPAWYEESSQQDHSIRWSELAWSAKRKTGYKVPRHQKALSYNDSQKRKFLPKTLFSPISEGVFTQQIHAAHLAVAGWLVLMEEIPTKKYEVHIMFHCQLQHLLKALEAVITCRGLYICRSVQSIQDTRKDLTEHI